jgi:hypothetical protein
LHLLSFKPDNEGRLTALLIRPVLFAISAACAIVAGIVAQRHGLGLTAIVIGFVAFLAVARILASLLTVAARMRTRIKKLRMKNLGESAASKNGNLFAERRARALRISVSDGLDANLRAKPFGVIMETGYPEDIATLVCFATGDASLYYSTGGGIIGGAGHEAVRHAAKRFVEESDPYSALMTPVTDYPLAAPTRTVFYVLTSAGVRSADFLELDLGMNRADFSPLFYAGQDVITKLRETKGLASE